MKEFKIGSYFFILFYVLFFGDFLILFIIYIYNIYILYIIFVLYFYSFYEYLYL